MPRDLLENKDIDQRDLLQRYGIDQEKSLPQENTSPFSLASVKELVAHPLQHFGAALTQPGNPIADFLQSGGQALGNAGISAYNALNELNRVPQLNVSPLTGANTDSIAGQLGGATGGAMGLLIPGLGIERGLSIIPQVAKAINPISRSIIGSYGAGALTAPEGERIETGLKNALFPGAIGAYGVGKAGANALLSRFGNATPEAAQTAAQMAGNLPVHLGDIVQSPTLQNIQKASEYVPLSSVGKTQDIVNEAAKEHSANILNNLKGNMEAEDIPHNIENEITINKINKKDLAAKKYDELADIADQSGEKLTDLPNVKAIAEKELKGHKTGFTPLPDKLASHLEEMINYPDKGMLSGILGGDKGLTYSKAVGKMKDYNEAARAAGKANPNVARIYGDLSDAIKKDIDKNAEESGNKQIGDKLRETTQFYKNEVAPYNSPFVQAIERGKSKPDTIHTNLLNGSDISTKILNDMSPEMQNAVVFQKMKNAVKQNPVTKEYESDPKALFNTYNKLTPLQKSNLPPGLDNEFNKLGFLAGVTKNKGAHAGEARVGLASAEATATLMHALHNPLGALGTLGAGLGASLGARALNKLLTSPSVRNAIVNRQSSQIPGISNVLLNEHMGAQ